MKYKYNKLQIGGFAIASLLLLSGCHSDNDAVEDEWTATYVYLQRVDYLSPSPKTFRIDHTEEGLSAGVDMPFVAKTQKPTSKDVRVNVELRNANAANVGLELQDKTGKKLESSQILIKAGEQHSDTFHIVATKISELKANEQKVSLAFDVALSSIETAQGNTHISPVSELNNLAAKIEKGALQTMKMGEPEVNNVLDRSSWTITLSEGAENPGTNLIDGNYWTDVARSGQGFTITIDVGGVKTITGINTTSWSWTTNRYAPQEVEVAVSKDNVTWKSLGTIQTSGGYQNITLLSRPKARYLKYSILKMPTTGRVSIVEFNLFGTDE